MLKLCFSLLTIIFCLIPNFGFSQFTRQQADDLVLNQILTGQLDVVDVYAYNDTKTPQLPVPVILYDSRTVDVPYPVC